MMESNNFLAGAGNKVLQWDCRSGNSTLEYDRHLNTVNNVTFIDNGRRFVSTADDKSVRIWEYGIPVDIKLISEPHMHSMPYVAVHPNDKWFICQSLDNQIVTYSAKERFKINRKKRFLGHLCAGYACQTSFSPDGRYVLSGDSDGRVFIWDWKSTRVYKTLKSHKGVCIGAIWHPIEASRVATCGWDGAIHYWD